MADARSLECKTQDEFLDVLCTCEAENNKKPARATAAANGRPTDEHAINSTQTPARAKDTLKKPPRPTTPADDGTENQQSAQPSRPEHPSEPSQLPHSPAHGASEEDTDSPRAPAKRARKVEDQQESDTSTAEKTMDTDPLTDAQLNQPSTPKAPPPSQKTNRGRPPRDQTEGTPSKKGRVDREVVSDSATNMEAQNSAGSDTSGSSVEKARTRRKQGVMDRGRDIASQRQQQKPKKGPYPPKVPQPKVTQDMSTILQPLTAAINNKMDNVEKGILVGIGAYRANMTSNTKAITAILNQVNKLVSTVNNQTQTIASLEAKITGLEELVANQSKVIVETRELVRELETQIQTDKELESQKMKKVIFVGSSDKVVEEIVECQQNADAELTAQGDDETLATAYDSLRINELEKSRLDFELIINELEKSRLELERTMAAIAAGVSSAPTQPRTAPKPMATSLTRSIPLVTASSSGSQDVDKMIIESWTDLVGDIHIDKIRLSTDIKKNKMCATELANRLEKEIVGRISPMYIDSLYKMIMMGNKVAYCNTLVAIRKRLK